MVLRLDDSATGAGTSPYEAPAVTSVPEAVQRMEEIQAYVEGHEPAGQHDGIACFNYIYLVITRRILDGIDHQFFADDSFVARLDVTFANRYFAALRASVLQPAAVPECWAVLIDRRSDPHITRLQMAAAGINAHVNFDLGVAVADTCAGLGLKPDSGSQHASYQQINQLFAEEVQNLRQHLESGWERLIDRITFERVSNQIDAWTMKGIRDVAWEDAEHLWTLRQHGDDGAEFIRHLDELASETGRLVLVPVI
jgi:hypothetical protein